MLLHESRDLFFHGMAWAYFLLNGVGFVFVVFSFPGMVIRSSVPFIIPCHVSAAYWWSPFKASEIWSSAFVLFFFCTRKSRCLVRCSNTAMYSTLLFRAPLTEFCYVMVDLDQLCILLYGRRFVFFSFFSFFLLLCFTWYDVKVRKCTEKYRAAVSWWLCSFSAGPQT